MQDTKYLKPVAKLENQKTGLEIVSKYSEEEKLELVWKPQKLYVMKQRFFRLGLSA